MRLSSSSINVCDPIKILVDVKNIGTDPSYQNAQNEITQLYLPKDRVRTTYDVVIKFKVQ